MQNPLQLFTFDLLLSLKKTWILMRRESLLCRNSKRWDWLAKQHQKMTPETSRNKIEGTRNFHHCLLNGTVSHLFAGSWLVSHMQVLSFANPDAVVDLKTPTFWPGCKGNTRKLRCAKVDLNSSQFCLGKHVAMGPWMVIFCPSELRLSFQRVHPEVGLNELVQRHGLANSRETCKNFL